MADGLLDEAYERFHHTGPEFEGWLSNHGPMAADALIRLCRADAVDGWVDEYAQRLEEAPRARWPISEDDWREPLGDPSRLGDWCALFAGEVRRAPWEDLLARWWPRLLPGAIASATHGLIRTGHAVRALREVVTTQRLDEFAQALGYWAARWQPLPGQRLPGGHADVGAATDGVPVLGVSGGVRTRIAQLDLTPAWPSALGGLRPVTQPAAVPAALDLLVDAAVTHYEPWAHGSPIMLVHAATAPRAAALALPALPIELHIPTYNTAWAVSAAISAAYRPSTPALPRSDVELSTPSAEDVTDLAVATRDEHAIKFVEVVQESHRRGNPYALVAGARAAALLATGS
ncbi:MAG: DUF4243 domain-containing protein [Geodermatophilaceae bacterium]|nr:DUF4243 domain-containing protein [Geodermatophilaceae bacterium]MDQ3454568.1 questin oxidase family protein [Actinomycetota bacterium]